MGYSCTKDAGDMVGVINKMCGLKEGTLHIDGERYFFERGREQGDGAVTGTLMKMVGENLCRPAGGVRINPDGSIARFPKFTANDKAEALKILRTTDPQLIRTWSMGVL